MRVKVPAAILTLWLALSIGAAAQTNRSTDRLPIVQPSERTSTASFRPSSRRIRGPARDARRELARISGWLRRMIKGVDAYMDWN